MVKKLLIVVLAIMSLLIAMVIIAQASLSPEEKAATATARAYVAPTSTPTPPACPDEETKRVLSRLDSDLRIWAQTSQEIGNAFGNARFRDPQWQKTMREDLEFLRYMNQQIIESDVPPNLRAGQARLAYVSMAELTNKAIPFLIMGVRGADVEDLDKGTDLMAQAVGEIERGAALRLAMCQ